MKKIYYLLICILILMTTACTKQIDKVTLDNKYYNNGEFINVNSEELSSLEDDSFILYTYNNYCAFAKPCEDVFKEFMTKYKIDFLSIKFEDFKNTKYYNKIKYAPSIIIINKGKIISYLDPNSDDDLNKYQEFNDFETWLTKYIEISNN